MIEKAKEQINSEKENAIKDIRDMAIDLSIDIASKVIEKNIDLSLASNIIIDTIHSIKGGEAQHVCVYEKSNWPAHFENKVGLARSSESRVWYVAVTRAKESYIFYVLIMNISSHWHGYIISL